MAPEERAKEMRRVNPAFIPRNHRVEETLSAAAEQDDYQPFETMLKILSRPFDDQPDYTAYMDPPPGGRGDYRTF